MIYRETSFMYMTIFKTNVDNKIHMKKSFFNTETQNVEGITVCNKPITSSERIGLEKTYPISSACPICFGEYLNK